MTELGKSAPATLYEALVGLHIEEHLVCFFPKLFFPLFVPRHDYVKLIWEAQRPPSGPLLLLLLLSLSQRCNLVPLNASPCQTSGKHSATLLNIRAGLTPPPGSQSTGMTEPYHSPGVGQG